MLSIVSVSFYIALIYILVSVNKHVYFIKMILMFDTLRFIQLDHGVRPHSKFLTEYLKNSPSCWSLPRWEMRRASSWSMWMPYPQWSTSIWDRNRQKLMWVFHVLQVLFLSDFSWKNLRILVLKKALRFCLTCIVCQLLLNQHLPVHERVENVSLC